MQYLGVALVLFFFVGGVIGTMAVLGAFDKK